MSETAPNYDLYQSAFHDAFRNELYAVLDSLPLPRAGSALDLPCGNGFYTARLAKRLGAGARLVAVDTSEAYLDRARAAVGTVRSAGEVQVVRGDAYALPHEDRSFDLVWCAQSLISLEPERVVREMYRVAKADGTVAILEVDQFHHVLLPWPAELEAAMAGAVLEASVRRYGDGVKLSPARQAHRLLRRCGFRSVRRTTVAIDRAAPFDAATTAFLDHHLKFLKSVAYPHLAAPLRDTFDRLTDPAAPDSLFRQPESELVCVNAVYFAQP